MAKTNPIGVRFEEEVLKYLKETFKVESPQKALNFMSNYFKQGIGMLPNGSLKPETATLLQPNEKKKKEPNQDGIPRTLDELKALCPKELTGFDRSKWISTERVKYKI